jgi:hypothetical protein
LWLLSGAFFTCVVAANGLIGPHMKSACLDPGTPELTAKSPL